MAIKKSEIMAVNVQIAKLLAEGKTKEALELVNSQNEKMAKPTGAGRKSSLFVDLADDLQAKMKGLPDGLYKVIGGIVAVAPIERDINGVKARFMVSYSYPGGKSAKALAKEGKTEGKAEAKTEGKAEVKAEGKKKN